MKTNKKNQSNEGLLSRPDQHITKESAKQQTPAPAATAAATPERKPLLPPMDFAKRQVNRNLPTELVIELIKTEAPDLAPRAQRVGDWIWIQVPDKQPREVTSRLALLGFHWNNARQAWQHPCGKFIHEPSSHDPRRRYATQPVTA
jgi:hypothetical protein